MNLDDLLERFYRRCRVRNLAESTVATYRRSLVVWRRAMPDDAAVITLEHLEQFLDQWDVKAKTKGNVISLIKELFGYAVEAELLPTNPARALDFPNLPERQPRYLSPEQLRDLLDLAGTATAPKDVWYTTRNYALVLFLADTGCRVGEACNLPRAEVQPDRARVCGKGRRERVVFFCSGTYAALRAHWRLQITGKWCFENRTGTRTQACKVRDLFHRYSDKLGYRVYPHLLRHTCATLMLEHSGNVRLVQEQLGHKSIKTTEIYAHVREQHRGAVHEEISAVR